MTTKGAILVYIMLLGAALAAAQPGVTNPFFKEPGFFTSETERAIFTKSNPQEPVDVLLALMVFSGQPETKKSEAQRAVNDLCKHLESRYYRSDMAYLKAVFKEVHMRYLKKYQRYATFDRLLQDGSYDCLTGTALYALVLEQLGFSYTIRETAVHSYLLVEVNHAKVIFESTDPLYGFIKEPDVIAEREALYAAETSNSEPTGLTGYRATKGTGAMYSADINLLQLAGLHYFNQGVIRFNLKDYRASTTLLEKAFALYPSNRISSLIIASSRQMLEEKGLPRFDFRKYSGKVNYYHSVVKPKS